MMSSCKDCGTPTVPGRGSARCVNCWDSRFGNSDVKFNKSGTIAYVDKEKAREAADKTFQKLQEMAKKQKPIEDDTYFLHLIIQLISSARHKQMEQYRKTKKEIKRLQLENKEAREFFKISFASLKI